MNTRKQFLTALGTGFASVALGADRFLQGSLPLAPKLEFSFKAIITVGEIQEVGVTPHGRRRIIQITGGTIEGPNIKGIVVPGGADWQIVRTDGVSELVAQYTLKTDDGALIYISNKGYRHGPAEVLDRISKGEDVDPGEYYFRTVPTFETASKRYDDFNKYIFVGTGERKKQSVTIHFYRVL